jgi:hypothetical protein
MVESLCVLQVSVLAIVAGGGGGGGAGDGDGGDEGQFGGMVVVKVVMAMVLRAASNLPLCLSRRCYFCCDRGRNICD